jgi:hypothetical protein
MFIPYSGYCYINNYNFVPSEYGFLLFEINDTFYTTNEHLRINHKTQNNNYRDAHSPIKPTK